MGGNLSRLAAGSLLLARQRLELASVEVEEELLRVARRRGALLRDIAGQRDRMAEVLDSLRLQPALAGLGLLAGRPLRRSRWLRRAAAAAAVVGVAMPMVARLVAPRR